MKFTMILLISCVRLSTLDGPFSAVSTPIFTTKYSFCSVFRFLQEFRTFAPLEIKNFSNFHQNFVEISSKFCKFTRSLQISRNFQQIWWKINERNVYANEAGKRAGTPRILVNVIVTSKQPSKVQIWTPILNFRPPHLSKISVSLHNSLFPS